MVEGALWPRAPYNLFNVMKMYLLAVERAI